MFNGLRRCVVTPSLSVCSAWPSFERHRYKLRGASQNARYGSKVEVPPALTARPLQRRKRIPRVVAQASKSKVNPPVPQGGWKNMDSQTVKDALEIPENENLKGGAPLKRTRAEDTSERAAVEAQQNNCASQRTVAAKALRTDTNACAMEAAAMDSAHNEKEQKEGENKIKKKKEGLSPVWARIITAMKKKNAPDAWETYQAHKADFGFKPSQLQPLATLFLGLEDWAHNVIELRAADDKTEITAANPEWAQVVMDELESKGNKKDEIWYCQRARMCAVKGDPDGALAAAVDCSLDPNARVRLRTYVPALAAYASKGDGAGALKVFDTICSETAELVDLSQSEYKFLLHVLGTNGDLEGLQRVWLHMKENLSTLEPLTISLITKYFEEHAGVKEDGSKKWKLSTVKVDPKGDGHVEEAGGHLQQARLTEDEWKQFAKAIHDLAVTREKTKGTFETFARVMAKNEYTIFLDAANIAFFNTLWMTDDAQPNARFQWRQVKAVYEAVQQRFPERVKEIMVVVSGGRVWGSCVHGPEEQEFLNRLQAERRLWCTPKGSNDDWYWLYGAVSQGEKGILVSNDKLRDHIFDLLRPRFFLKWRDNQKCLYDVATHQDRSIYAQLQLPPCFTTCVQKVDESGAWMFPMEEEQWLCARPL